MLIGRIIVNQEDGRQVHNCQCDSAHRELTVKSLRNTSAIIICRSLDSHPVTEFSVGLPICSWPVPFAACHGAPSIEGVFDYAKNTTLRMLNSATRLSDGPVGYDVLLLLVHCQALEHPGRR